MYCVYAGESWGWLNGCLWWTSTWQAWRCPGTSIKGPCSISNTIVCLMRFEDWLCKNNYCRFHLFAQSPASIFMFEILLVQWLLYFMSSIIFKSKVSVSSNTGFHVDKNTNDCFMATQRQEKTFVKRAPTAFTWVKYIFFISMTFVSSQGAWLTGVFLHFSFLLSCYSEDWSLWMENDYLRDNIELVALRVNW